MLIVLICAAMMFAGVGAYDPVCARHALALASLVARDPNGCGVFIKEIGPLLQTNVQECRRTGGVQSWSSRVQACSQGVGFFRACLAHHFANVALT